MIFEQNTKEFHKIPDKYLHHGKNIFDTGLQLELLQECYLIALDVFRKSPSPKDRSKQTAWLSLLATEILKDAEKPIPEYPWPEEIYAEIAMLRQKPEEMPKIFSEALRIPDQNTVHFMIDEMKKELLTGGPAPFPVFSYCRHIKTQPKPASHPICILFITFRRVNSSRSFSSRAFEILFVSSS